MLFFVDLANSTIKCSIRIWNRNFIDSAFNLSFWKDIDVICNANTEESCNQDRFVPDPSNFDLPQGFIYIENEWGSLFYKHLGKMTKNDAKTNCSSFGSTVHLPIPRFLEEFGFYISHFGYDSSSYNDSEGLWPLLFVLKNWESSGLIV